MRLTGFGSVIPLIPSVSLEICTVMTGNVIKDAWVVPYVLTIIYEIGKSAPSKKHPKPVFDMT